MAWGWLAILTNRPEPLPIGQYWAVLAVAWLMLGSAWWAARQVGPRPLLVAIWVWAVVWRAVGLFGQPVYEDDWARYLWDGRQLVETGQPYGKPPQEFFGDESLDEAWTSVLDGINHPDIPTVYPPVCQAVFGLSYAIAPAQLWPLKGLLIAVECAILALLSGLVSRRAHLLVFGWCPLLIQETAFSAHPEALWVGAVAAALVARRRGWTGATGVCCGLAVAAKIFAAPIVPILLWDGCWRRWVAGGAVAVATVASLYAPFWLQGSTADWAGLSAMAGDWEFNSTVFKGLTHLMSPSWAKGVCLSVFAAVWLGLVWRWRAADRKSLPRGDVLYGAFFLLSSVVNPWYLAVLALFATLHPRGWNVAALAAMPLSYAHGLNMLRPDLAPYELAGWVRPLEAAVVCVGTLAGYLLGRTGSGAGSGSG